MQEPLVSVIIGTYNSAAFILETLESIRAQTYPNLELIVTDDSSKDNSVTLINHWLQENAARFHRVQLVQSNENTGIVRNANRALAVVGGVWVKFLGGDDLLLPRCIESNMAVAAMYPNQKLIAGRIVAFDSDTNQDLAVLPRHTIPANDGVKQLRGLLRGNYVKSPGVFICKDLFDVLGFFDTRYPMFEDDPFWIKANLAGYYFVENDEVLVRYRIHAQSVSNAKGKFVNPIFYPSLKLFRLDVVCPMLKRNGMYSQYLYNVMKFWLSDRVFRKGNRIESPRNILERLLLKAINILR